MVFGLHPDEFGRLTVWAIGGLAAYIFIWKKNSRLANWLVLLVVAGLFCYFTDWSYLMRDYFRVKWGRIG